jgi:hypothetical protein
MVESYTPANAGLGDSDDVQDDDDDENPFNECHDDGDDGENPGLVDEPDQEENEEENPYGEVGDGEDEDPYYEDDDPQNCRALLPDTGSPSPTPCPSFITQGGGGSECCPVGVGVDGDVGAEGFLCICFGSAGNVVAEGGEPPCFCIDGDFGCLCDVTDLGGTPDCCVYFGGCQSATAVSSADADCDGEVTPVDAYETLVVLSGFEASTEDCGGGDADCSDAIDAKDTLAILAVVAGLEEATAC